MSRGSNQSGIRAYNERLVLTLIRQNGPLAKVEIARRTGLSAQTVSVIMRALEADGLLGKGEPVRGKVGQPSVPMGLQPDGAFFLGLKIGQRSLDLILTDFLGAELGRRSLRNTAPLPRTVTEFTNASIGALLETLTKAQRARVAGLGIATPFRLWEFPTPFKVDKAEMQGWRDYDLAAELHAEWGFPVYLQNDASCACGAELVFGDQNKPANFLYYFIGYFIGGGLVLDNALYTGSTGNAAAFGSTPIGVKGGKIVQLFNVASLANLEREMSAATGDNDAVSEDSRAWNVPDHILDPWIMGTAQGLTYAIASATSVIDVECVILDGSIPQDVRARIVEITQRQLRSLTIPGLELPYIREGSVGPDARAFGAASLPLADRFMVDRAALLSAGQ
ncbi:ROK family transcriptional regulator [Tropicibacter naphthalenivorans]|nr:ROK family transcriptional regulator [Tropicibacter naphthalenivorans]